MKISLTHHAFIDDFVRPVFIAAIFFIFLSPSSYSQILRIWAVDDGEKIKKEDLNNPLAEDPLNAVWKNKNVNLFGGRNEIVAFQLILQAGNNGAEKVNVSISDLRNSKFVIPGSAKSPSDPFDYRSRYIELFTEHYFNISKKSPTAWFYAASASPSDYYLGWTPDCLIPFAAPAGKGGAPFSIEKNSNQAVWADVYIPRNSKSGIYKGKITVTVSGIKFMDIPLVLEAYDFTLPDTNHLSTMFFFRSAAGRHGIKAGDSIAAYELENKYFQMAHRHRFDLVRGARNLTEMTNHYLPYFTGEIYSPMNKYGGPGEKTGNSTYSITGFPLEYGGSLRNMNESNWRRGSDAWENWFIKNAPGVQRHRYLWPDEPKGSGKLDTIKLQGKWTNDNPGIGRNLKGLMTSNIRESLKGYIGFWSVSAQTAMRTKPADIASEREKGVLYGVYNGYRPGFGAVITDADAVEFRVMPWIVWKYNLDQYFYWQTAGWGRLNVFINPLTYEDRINGDGTFFYPGKDVLFPEESRNLNGPLSSIRMKNWRRGAQDYEYLWLAKKAGLGTQAEKIVNECVPAALWEADPSKNISWSSRGYKFEQYRKKLAILIDSQGK